MVRVRCRCIAGGIYKLQPIAWHYCSIIDEILARNLKLLALVVSGACMHTDALALVLASASVRKVVAPPSSLTSPSSNPTHQPRSRWVNEGSPADWESNWGQIGQTVNEVIDQAGVKAFSTAAGLRQ